MPHAVNVLLVDGHPIYRRGLADCLNSLPGVETVTESDRVPSASEAPGSPAADLVMLDRELPRACDFVRELNGRARVIAFYATDADDITDVIAAGAVGLLHKSSLTPETLGAAVDAACSGASVISPEVLSSLVRLPRPRASLATSEGPAAAPRLTAREQQVLALIAQGHATREVAARLCYSERTVKNVLHDVVTKLGARSRAQAVADAVRIGLI
jgi:DNA-binding NarL/FixJ family response regulator